MAIYKNMIRRSSKMMSDMAGVSKRSYTSISDYVMGGGAIGAIGGAVTGIAAGAALPLYVGWKAGDYLSDKLQFPYVVGVATDLVSSCVTLTVTGGVTVPVLFFTGLAAGAVIGGTTGLLIGTGKKGLEAVLDAMTPKK